MPDYIRNPDPEHPGRPQHPDFWVLSEAIIENDEYADSGRRDERVAQFIDAASLDYMALQRAQMAAMITGADQVATAGGIIDGFVLGCAYMKKKLEQQYGTGKSG